MFYMESNVVMADTGAGFAKRKKKLIEEQMKSIRVSLGRAFNRWRELQYSIKQVSPAHHSSAVETVSPNHVQIPGQAYYCFFRLISYFLLFIFIYCIFSSIAYLKSY